MIVTIRVKTGAKADSIVLSDDSKEYLVKVTARPIEGDANRAIIELLSQELGVPKSQIELHSGAKSKVKRFNIDQ